MAGVRPEPGKRHFVVIGGEHYPVKQALARVLGLERSEFLPQGARRIFGALGFRLVPPKG